MHARILPALFVGLLLVTVAYVAGAFDLPTVASGPNYPVVSSADEPRRESAAILAAPVRLEQGSSRVAIRDDRWLNPGWELVALFYPFAFGLMANCDRTGGWFPNWLSDAWAYVVGVLTAVSVIRFLIRADQTAQAVGKTG